MGRVASCVTVDPRVLLFASWCQDGAGLMIDARSLRRACGKLEIGSHEAGEFIWGVETGSYHGLPRINGRLAVKIRGRRKRARRITCVGCLPEHLGMCAWTASDAPVRVVYWQRHLSASGMTGLLSFYGDAKHQDHPWSAETRRLALLSRELNGASHYV